LENVSVRAGDQAVALRPPGDAAMRSRAMDAGSRLERCRNAVAKKITKRLNLEIVICLTDSGNHRGVDRFPVIADEYRALAAEQRLMAETTPLPGVRRRFMENAAMLEDLASDLEQSELSASRLFEMRRRPVSSVSPP
jgi:hypothetical protein